MASRTRDFTDILLQNGLVSPDQLNEAERMAEYLLEDVQPVWHLYDAYDIREILQTVRIPLADVVAQNPDVDLDALDELELDFDYDGDRGTVLVTDIELAA